MITDTFSQSGRKSSVIMEGPRAGSGRDVENMPG